MGGGQWVVGGGRSSPTGRGRSHGGKAARKQGSQRATAPTAGWQRPLRTEGDRGPSKPDLRAAGGGVQVPLPPHSCSRWPRGPFHPRGRPGRSSRPLARAWHGHRRHRGLSRQLGALVAQRFGATVVVTQLQGTPLDPPHKTKELTHRHGPRGSGWVWPAPSGPGRENPTHCTPLLSSGRAEPGQQEQSPGTRPGGPGSSSPLRAESRAERCWHCREGTAGHLCARPTGSEPAATAHWATQPSRSALVTAQAARPRDSWRFLVPIPQRRKLRCGRDAPSLQPGPRRLPSPTAPVPGRPAPGHRRAEPVRGRPWAASDS